MRILRLIVGLLIGLALGALLNGLIITLGLEVFPLPKGVNFETAEGKHNFQYLKPIHFLFPFLAHALGTFFGVLISLFISKRFRLLLTFIISTLFFLGGLSMVLSLDAPQWFNLTDLTLAYFPMGFMAYRMKRARKA
ncbi:MAG: hypothetical protein WCG64_04435 [Flavobacteriia bacterium]